MLIGTFFNVLAIPAYHTLLGLGKASASLISAFIISGGNFLIVSFTALVFGYVTVSTIFAGLTFLYLLSSMYLNVRAYRTISSFSVEVIRVDTEVAA